MYEAAVCPNTDTVGVAPRKPRTQGGTVLIIHRLRHHISYSPSNVL